VETLPADALGEWFIDHSHGKRTIDVQLAHAASATNDVAVIIRAKLPRSEFSNIISADALRIVQWRGGPSKRHLVAFETNEPIAVEPIGALPAIEPAAIDEEVKSLLGTNVEPATVFDLTAAGGESGLKLITKRGQFAADILSEASLVRQELQHEHHIIITPTSNRVDRVLIAATSSLGKDVHWSETPSGTKVSAEQLPSDDPRRAGLPDDGELWLVQLPRGSATPIEIVATASGKLSEPGSLPLLAAVDAVEQRGRVLIRADSDSTPNLVPLNMTASPLPVETRGDAEKSPPVRAAYRFNPADCFRSSRTPQLRITNPSGQKLIAMVARRVMLDSYIASDGHATHRATYYLTNESASPFNWQLPRNATLRSLAIDGHAVSRPVGASTEPQMPLAIPKGQSVVAISFEVDQRPLAAGCRLSPPLLTTNATLLAGQWNVRLPEEFSISMAGSTNWRQRLFGPLGRPDGVRPFQLFRPSDWARLLNAITSMWAGGDRPMESLAGWRTYSTTFVAEAPSDIEVSHPAATHAWAVSVFLVFSVAGAWTGQHRRGARAALLAVAGCVAFLLPAVLAPLAAGAIWGLLL
jgi:hypothetical protein